MEIDLIGKVKDILNERETIRQSSLQSLLRTNKTCIDEAIGLLEREGFLRKGKVLYKGHRVNQLEIVKQQGQGTEWSFLNDSPCFLCPRLYTCGEDPYLNFKTCPNLNSWLKKN